jgi:hypothetical protein
MRSLPTFLVVGAAKSGTTSLHYFMEQHPEICVPPCKETYIFCQESMAGTWPAVDTYYDEEGYRELFRAHTTERTKAWGEVTTSNLYYHREAVPKIKALLGDVRIIFLLRNPIDRAYSGWTMAFASYGEPLSFEEAIEDEQNRIEQKVNFMGHYLSLGFYHQGVKNYLENFPQHRVCLLEDLKERPRETLREIFEFIGVDGGFTPDYQTTYNPSGIPRSRLLQRLMFRGTGTAGTFVQRMMRLVMKRSRADRLFHTMRKYNLKRVPMKRETRRKLADIYREDVLKLQDLIKRDLSHWLEI